MNACPVLLFLFLLSTSCLGKEQNDSPASDMATATKEQKEPETRLDEVCPEPTEILPCVCRTKRELTMDCSKVHDEVQLRKVFSAYFPKTDFEVFFMNNNTGVKVLEDGVFGNVSFVAMEIKRSALETVSIDALTSSRTTLQYFFVFESPLAIFPFDNLTELTELLDLTLIKTKIQSLPPLSSASLDDLDVSINSISHISPDTFKFLPNVRRLHFNNNHLTEITPGTFKGMQKFKFLQLFGNDLRHLQNFAFTFGDVPEYFLNLSDNNIESLEVDTFKELPVTNRTSVIDMSSNALTTLDEKVWTSVLMSNVVVVFKGNDLSCDCDVAWLIRHPEMLMKTDGAHCADGKLLKDLDPNDFRHCN